MSSRTLTSSSIQDNIPPKLITWISEIFNVSKERAIEIWSKPSPICIECNKFKNIQSLLCKECEDNKISNFEIYNGTTYEDYINYVNRKKTTYLKFDKN